MSTYVLKCDFNIMPKKEHFRLQLHEEDRLEQDPRRWRARIKRDSKNASEHIKKQEFLERTKFLQRSRAEASLARGIKNYRERMELSRSEMAESIGITRRALFNYEEGKRSFPGHLLEKILKRGEAELYEYFAIPNEPGDNEQRKTEAHLAIALFRQCKVEFPLAEDSHLQDLAVDRAVRWQKDIKATAKNIAKAAAETVDELKDRYNEEFIHEELPKE